MIKKQHSDEEPNENKKLTINITSQMIEFLVARYKDNLNISLPEFPEHFAKKSGISKRAVFSWIQKEREKPIKLRASSRESLSEYFATVLPNIPSIWFTLEKIEIFRKKIINLEANTKSRGYPCFGIPENKIFFDDIEKLRRDIKGLYILYRFSFTPKNNNQFIREVLHIDKDQADLKFTSYYSTNLNFEDYHSSFYGTCIPINETIHLSGTEWGIYQRSRTFLFTKSSDNIPSKKVLFGMLLSSNLNQKMPCAAKVLLLRYTTHDIYPEKNISSFAKKLCKYSGDIISQDFKENPEIIKNLLSNKINDDETTLFPSRETAEALFSKEQIHKNWIDRIKLSL